MSIGKPSFKNISKPRPYALFLLGESLERIAKASAIGSIFVGYKWAPIILIIVGEVGNGLTKLYADPNHSEPVQTPEKGADR